MVAIEAAWVNPDARRGRGAVSNASGRYEASSRVVLDDGWGGLDAPAAPLRTTVVADTSRTVIARNKSPDIGFDRSVNPYRGCEHGCIYCYARPSHAWLGLSPGLDFESRLFAKHDAPELLAKELSKPGYVPDTLILGANTDAYQPVERTLGITRRILEVLAEFKHPVGIITKSALVARDIDILAPMAAQGLARVFVSVTSLDRRLARKMEPRAAAPERCITTIRSLAEAGIPTGVMVAPILPGLTDHEMEKILARAARAGAARAGYIVLRLPLEIKDLFTEWAQDNLPDRAERMLTQIRRFRRGKLYDAAFGKRLTGQGTEAALLADRFHIACARFGLATDMPPMNNSLFQPPSRQGDQFDLFYNDGKEDGS